MVKLQIAPYEKIEYGGKITYAGQTDYGVNSKYPIPLDLAQEVVNDIQFPLHWLDVPVFLFPFRLMVYDKGMFTGLEYNGRAYPTHIVYGARNQTPTKEDIGSLIIHEIGHALCYKYVDPDFSDKQFTPKMQEYMKLRGLEGMTDNDEWEYRPSEIFAEDFRHLFGTGYMRTEEFLPYKHVPPPTEAIREWMLSLVPEPKEVEPMRWSHIMVHHTGAEEENTEQIRQYHLSLGWRDIGYHFVIERDGKVVEGRPLTDRGAHCNTDDWNGRAIGIALIGNFENHPPTLAQYRGLAAQVEVLMRRYGIPLANVIRHKDVAATDCGGRYFDFETLKEEVKALADPKKTGSTQEVSEWAKDAQAWAVAEGITDGTRPKDAVTREELWTMLYRMIKKGE